MKSKNSSDIETIAARWAARVLSGTPLSGSERAEHERWLSENADGAALFREYMSVVDRVDDAAAAELEHQFIEELNQSARPRTWLHAGAAIAATLMLTLAVSVFFVARSPYTETYQTAVGARQAVTFADGSTANLNTNTKAELEITRDKRTVALMQGEALFSVVSDVEKPFVVEAGFAEIIVTGTQFNVRKAADLVIVSVLSGSVAVQSSAGASVNLAPGEQIDVAANGVLGQVSAFDQSRQLAWREGKARFNGARLDDVVAELNRHFDRPVVIGDQAISGMLVTGEFDLDDPSTATEALATAFSLELRRENSTVVLLPRTR